MENFINILLWISLSVGGLMVLMLSFSVLFSFDVDLDIYADTNSDNHTGNLGFLKSFLLFVLIGSFTARAIALHLGWSSGAALIAGVLAGIGVILLLSKLLKLLLRQAEMK